jgi:hypothetical protein
VAFSAHFLSLHSQESGKRALGLDDFFLFSPHSASASVYHVLLLPVFSAAVSVSTLL